MPTGIYIRTDKTRKTLSESRMGFHHSAEIIAKIALSKTKTREKIICLNCKKEFEALASTKRKYCSLNCFYSSKERKEKISKGVSNFLKNRNETYHKNYQSKSEIYFGDSVFKNFNIILQPSIWIQGRCFDYKIPNKNVLIEIDGSWWHSKPIAIENDKLKNEIAEQNGYKLYRFSINSIKEAEKFIQENHNLLAKILGE